MACASQHARLNAASAVAVIKASVAGGGERIEREAKEEGEDGRIGGWTGDKRVKAWRKRKDLHAAPQQAF